MNRRGALKLRGWSGPLGRATLLLMLLASFGSVAAEGPAPANTGAGLPEARTRELYVPYADFLKLPVKQRDGMLMTLEEYRALVALAFSKEDAPSQTPPPPLRAVLDEAVYTGVADEDTARFETSFKLTIAGNDWVRCELGPALPGLGEITLDKQPAWVLNENGRLYLLAQGAGQHAGHLIFSVPLRKEEEVVKFASPLLNAATAVLRLSVPGRNTAAREDAAASAQNVSAPPEVLAPLDVQYDAAKNVTLFSLALGKQAAAALRWKRRYDAEKNPPLLLATHAVSYLLERASPLFRWQARITIARRKTEELEFREPPGGQIVRLSGSGVHSWRREGGLIHVLLERPTLGVVELRADGVITGSPAAAYGLGCPAVQNATQETRLLALLEPPGTKVSVEQTEGLSELARNEAAVPALGDGRLTRVFVADAPDAKISVRAAAPENVFDVQTTASVSIDEKDTGLRALLSVQPQTGRLYALKLNVPDGWTTVDWKERGSGRGVAGSLETRDGRESWTLLLSEAADAKHPLQLEATLRPREAAKEGWQKQALSIALPQIEGCRRSHALLGLAISPVLETAFGQISGWRAETAGAFAQAGIPAAFLRAALATDSPIARVNVTLERKRCRGEYDLITHVLTQEREVSVRSDIRLAVLDQTLDELVLNLPADAKEPLRISPAFLIKEVLPGETPSQRRVRFTQPWQGVRMLRVEYRAPLKPGSDVAIPDVRLGGNFDSRRRIVFQSGGPVKLEITPGAGLAEALLEDIPDFAVPFAAGRPLFAYTLREGRPAGTFRTTLLEQAPLLNSAVNELKLQTVIDASGVSRTYASFILDYARDQYLNARIPREARLLALSVADQSVRPVKSAAPDVIAIPLPPKSSVRIELAYERRLPQLGSQGTWTEDGLDLQGVPVGTTQWSLQCPGEYLFAHTGGNLTLQPEPAPAFFAASFFKPLLSGRSPRWTAWETAEAGEFHRFAPLPLQAKPETARTAASGGLHALEDARAAGERAPELAAACVNVMSGHRFAAFKLGGAPVAVFAYRTQGWDVFTSRAVFFLALLAGLALWWRLSLKAAAIYTVAGLGLGTALPAALGWQSPLLAVPFCEGVSACALLVLCAAAWRGLRWLWRKNLLLRAHRTAPLLLLALAPASFAYAPETRAAESDPVVIPYAPADLRAGENPLKQKVYVPKERFLELMRKAHPETIEPPRNILGATATTSLALGNAEYRLSVDKETFQVAGTLAFRTFNKKEWSKLPLDFVPEQLVKLTLDGAPASVSTVNGQPFVQVLGEGAHTLALELKGALEIETGRVQLRTRLMGGAAVRLLAVLPPNAELNQKTLPAGASLLSDNKDEARQYEIDLGGGGAIALNWHTAGVQTRGTSQMTARSYTCCTLDRGGYWVWRHEQINVDGNPLDHVLFRICGNWEIATLSAPDLAEWTVSGTGGERRLEVWLQKPANTLSLELKGWAPLGATRAPLAGLTLEGALRQEGFVGLRHGGERKFSPNVLEGLRRSSLDELGTMFRGMGDGDDRLYRFYEPPAGQFLNAEPETAQVNLETQMLALVKPEHLWTTVRTRYRVNGPGPLRHEVDLPEGWTVRAAGGNLLDSWEVAERAGKNRLIAHFSSRAVSGTEFVWTAEAPLKMPAQQPLNLEIPLPHTAGEHLGESLDCVLAADSSLELSQDSATTLASVALGRAPAWQALQPPDDFRLAFHSSRNDGRLALQVSRRQSLGTYSVVNFISMAADYVQVNARCRFVFSQTGRESLRLRLPAGARLVTLDAPRLRSVENQNDPKGPCVTVWLQAPEAGEQLVDLAYRLPRADDQDAVVTPLRVEETELRPAESYVGLLQTERSLLAIAGKRGLEKAIEIEQLPFVPAVVSNTALKEAYVALPDWSVTLHQPEVQAEAGLDAEIMLAVVTTVVAPDGKVCSQASYTCRNRSRQFLQIALPEQAKLWSATVAGQPVAVSHTGVKGREVLQVPIPRMSLTDLPQEVVLLYENPPLALPAAFATFSPQAPEVLGTAVVETYWQLYAPKDYTVQRAGSSTVREVASSVLIGGKLKASTSEVERLLKVANSADSGWNRRKALRSLPRAQQELSDNATELENSGMENNRREAGRFDQADWNSQMNINGSIQQKAQAMQQRVQLLDKDMREASTQNADADESQAFVDRYRFQGNLWRAGNNASAAGKTGRPASSAPGAANSPVFQQDELHLPALPCLEQELKPLPLKGELGANPNSAWRGGGAASNMRLPVDGVVYTYWRAEGQPELTVRLVSSASSWRATAWGALALLALLGWIGWRRAAKARKG